jgi:hypothetical protein
MSWVLRLRECVCIGLVLIVAVGCGGAADCGPVGVSVSPNTATADHTAAPPGNQPQFFACNSFPIKQGCAAITAISRSRPSPQFGTPGS